MTSPVLGIDLGTTNSVVGVADDRGESRVLLDPEGNKLIPSVVSFHPSGEILVGYPAKERRLIDAKNTIYSVKRLIGRPFKSEEVKRARERFPFELREGPTGGVLVVARGETYTLAEISAFVLRQVRTVAEQAMGVPCTRAVVTVPANFNELQRSATKAAGRVAGLDVMRILNEPTAAALAYGYGRGSKERVAVFDLGGGTFDITILDLAGDVFEVIATAGDTYLGGDDIDVLIAEQMCDAFLKHHRYDPRQDRQAFERLRAAAEWAKCQLSQEAEVQLRVEELAYGEGGSSLDLAFAMTRTALERLIQPLIGRCFDVCEDAMRVAGIRPTQLDNVLLVGGSTRIPLVRSMVEEYFSRTPLSHLDPELVVAQGAAIQGAALGGGVARTTQSALARVPLKKVTQADLERAQVAREREREQPRMFVDVTENDALQDRTNPDMTDSDMTQPRYPAPGLPPAVLVGQTDPGALQYERAVLGQIDPMDDDGEIQTSVRKPLYTSRPPPPLDALPEPPTVARHTAAEGGAGGAAGAGSPTADFRSFEVDSSTTVPRPEPLPDVPTQARGAAPGPSAPPVPPKPPSAPPLPAQRAAAQRAAVPSAPMQVVGRRPSAPPPPPAPPAPPAGTSARPPVPMGARTQPMPGYTAPPPVAAAAAAGPMLGPPGPPAAIPGPALVIPGTAPPAPPPQMRAPVPQAPPQPMAAGFAGPGFAPAAAPPLLLDVTPQSLGIETVNGYCEMVIKRNAAIPVEQTRIFTTAQDDQQIVKVRICQGESRRLAENQAIGEIELAGLRRAARGDVKIGVTFVIDADGTLGVRAKDLETGREQRVRINLLGGMPEDEIQRMRARQQQLMR